MTKLSDTAPAARIAYQVLNQYFKRHLDDVVEIEILPPSVAPPPGQVVLEDDKAIGIPKRVLAGAFVEAAQIFFDGLNQAKYLDDRPGHFQHTLLDATRIILLFDPEHLTATNFRKRHLLEILARNGSNKKSSIEDSTATSLRQEAQREFCLLDSILTSNLHRQTKSPTLWNHRRWLYQLCLEHGSNHESVLKEYFLSQNTILSEFSIIMKAGERHRMNYYAWQYSRHFLRLIESHHSTENHQKLNDLASTLIAMVSEWCIKHPSDTSGLSFLLWLFSNDHSTTMQAEKSVAMILRSAKSFEWRQESITGFLRLAAANQDLLCTDLQREITQYIEPMDS